MAVVFDMRKEFVMQLAEEDTHFVAFPHNLSKYELVENLPPPIETPDDLPGNINKWLMYFYRPNQGFLAAIRILPS